MDELLAKRGRLRVRLEKVLRRITEFPFFSELDMAQQVWSLPEVHGRACVSRITRLL